MKHIIINNDGKRKNPGKDDEFQKTLKNVIYKIHEKHNIILK